MARLPVLTYPTPSLKKPSVDVKTFDAKLYELVESMFETMYFERGIGLAASQIGENLNLLVMDVGSPDPTDPENHEKRISNKICLINPNILSREGKILYEEGCLSCPELLVEVERDRNIVVASVDPEGRPQQHSLSELEAVCTQHEMDHLKGVLLTDKISRLKREIYGKQRLRERKSAQDKSELE
jgi:peptide deformylase